MRHAGAAQPDHKNDLISDTAGRKEKPQRQMSAQVRLDAGGPRSQPIDRRQKYASQANAQRAQ